MTQVITTSAPGEVLRALPRQYIKVLTRPSTSTFQGLLTVSNGWSLSLQLIFWMLVAAVMGWLARLLSPFNIKMLNSPTMVNSPHLNTALLHYMSLGSSLGMLILIPVIFLLDMGIMYGVARMSGGQGTFLKQCSMMLFFLMPLGVIDSIAEIVPYVGALCLCGSMIYVLVLQVIAVRAVHQLEQGKAMAAVLIPVAVLLMLSCIFSVVLFSLVIIMVK